MLEKSFAFKPSRNQTMQTYRDLTMTCKNLWFLFRIFNLSFQRENRIFPFFLYISFLFFAFSACSNDTEKQSVYLNNGKSYLNSGDYFMARLQFKQALRLDPKMADAYFNLGLAEIQLGNTKQALSNFLRTLSLAPENAGAHLQVGKIMLDAGFPEAAIQRADRVLAVDENHRNALKLKAAAILKLPLPQNNIQTAVRICEDLLSSGETSAEIFHLLASALLLQDKITAAKVRLAEGLAQNPQSELLYALLSRIYLKQGEIKSAIRTYQRLIAIAPNTPDHLFNLVELLWKTNQKEEAQNLLSQRMGALGAKDDSAWIRLSRFYAEKKEAALSENMLIAGLQTHPQSFELRLALARILIAKNDFITAVDRLEPSLSAIQSKPGSVIADAQLLLSESFLSIGELTLAGHYCDAYIENHPQDPKAHFIKGLIHQLNNNPQGATTEFWTVLEYNPLDNNARIQLAWAMTRTGQWQQAIEILTAGLQQGKNDSALRQALAQLYLYLRKPAEAETLFQEILAKTPDNHPVMMKLGDLYQSTGKIEKAVETYKMGLRTTPQSPEAYIRLGKIYSKEKKTAKAVELLETGSAVLPQSDDLLAALIDIYIETGKNGSALKAAKNRLASNPQDALGYFLLGRVYNALWEYTKSEKAYTDAIDLKPALSEAHDNLLDVWYRQKGRADIHAYYEEMIKKIPDAIAPRIGLARFYIKERDYPNAIELYEALTARHPEELSFSLDLIHLLCAHPRNKDDFAAAVKSAKEALKHHPDHPLVLDALGWAYYCHGDANLAQGYLYRTIELSPDLSIALYHLAKVSYETGDPKAAEYNLERLLANDPDFSEKEAAQEILKKIGTRNQLKK